MDAKPIIAFAVMALVATMSLNTAFTASVEARPLRSIDASAVTKYKTVRSEYLAVKADYLQAREKVRTAIARYKAFNEKTPERQLELIDEVKNFGHKSADFLRKQLETSSAYVEKSGELTQNMVDKINAQVAIYQAQLDQLDIDINAVTTIEELRVVKVKMVNEWRDQRGVIKWIVAQVAWGKANWVVEKLDSLRVIIQEKRDNAAANGKDVTALDAFVVKYDARLAEAKADLDKAKDIFENKVSNIAEFDGFAVTVNQHIKDANRAARNGYRELKSIAKEIISQ